MPDSGQQLHGQQRVPAQIEEVVVPTHALHTQQLLPDTRQYFFHRPLWCLVGMRDQRIRIRYRQRLPVDLAIGGERHRIELHKGRWHHVRRQLCPQMLAQRLHRRNIRFCQPLPGHPVGHQTLVARSAGVTRCAGRIFPVLLRRSGHNHHFPDGRQLGKPCLDLAELDPKAPDLDLEVVSAQVLDGTIGPPASQVSRSVHPGIGIIAERITHKALGCQLWPVQVASGHAISGNVDLAGHANRYRLTLRIQNVDLRI